jgi:hypothetical protein
MRSKVPPTVIDAEESDSPLWRQRLTTLQAWYDAEYARAPPKYRGTGAVDLDARRVRREPAAVVWRRTPRPCCAAAGRVGRRGSG